MAEPNGSIKAQQEAHSKMVIEQLAMDLHEAGREAVENGLTQNPGGAFVEWADSPERTKEGRRVQAALHLAALPPGALRETALDTARDLS